MPIIVEATATLDSRRRDIAAALIGLLDAAGTSTYLVDDLAQIAELPANYAELHLSTRGRGLKRSGRSSVTGWRAQVRVVGSTVGSAYLMLDRVVAALSGTALTVNAETSTPLDEQPSDPPGQDGAYYSALAEWTFAL